MTDCVSQVRKECVRMEYIGLRRKRLVNGNQSQLIVINKSN